MIEFSNLSIYNQVTYIVLYLSVAEGTIGIIGNILVFAVLSRKRLRNYSFAFYSKARVISDIIVLLHIYRHWSAIVLEANIDLTSVFACKIGEYTPWSAASVSVWLLSLSALDRLVAIVYPNRFSFFKKWQFQLSIVCLLVIYSCSVHILLIVYTDLYNVNMTNMSVLVCNIPDQQGQQQTYWINVIDQFVVVFFLNNILAAVIIYNIYKSRSKFRASMHSHSQRNENKSGSKDRKFAINSIFLNLKCFLLKAPLLIISLIITYIDGTPDAKNMIFLISVMFYTLDSSCVFFVDIIVNKLFYNEFRSIFIPNQSVHTTNTNGSTKNNSVLNTHGKSNIRKEISLKEHAPEDKNQ